MDYEISGKQLVKINLEEGERIFADPGKLIGKTSTISMTPRLVGGIISAMERKIVGNAAMLTVFEASGGVGSVSLSGILPGKVVAIELGEEEEFIAEHFAFLAAQDSVKFSIQALNVGAAFFGGTGIMLQKFVGPGIVFIQPVGETIEIDLDGTSPIEVDPGHIAGFDSSIKMNIKLIDNVRSAMFAKEGIFLATLSGKGRVILHSISRFKLAAALYTEGKEEDKGSN
jgi:uncharacterized protein (TIGR00266 family)